jgi:uncharacterized sporulation protein YeaH/YhbH (DUF444 family)
MSVILDRRKNPKGKSLANRNRFLERVRDSIKESAEDLKKKINDGTDIDVAVPTKNIKEPQFQYDRSTGIWDSILPGNKEYRAGDTISKPPNQNGGGDSSAGIDEDGEDDFRFSLSKEEYLNIIFDDLDLPDMVKKSLKNSNAVSKVRAGYTTVGQESNLNIIKTIQSSIGRRIALNGSTNEQIELIEKQLEETEDKTYLLEQLEILSKKKFGFLEQVDLRYNNYTNITKPSTTAVMFCVMDVSGSMDEAKKTTAKKFFLLLYAFLKKKHKNIDVIFIRHTDDAEEVTEDEFFYGNKTGGTKISSAFVLLDKLIKERYNVNETNIYIAQASDGDNYGNDNEELQKILKELLPKIQLMTYIEITSLYGNTALWNTLLSLSQHENLILKHIRNDMEIITKFREIFRKRK